jgi:hypothetical protein
VSRLVQECLTNIHRHSESKSAQICISREAKELSLVVQVTASAAKHLRLPSNLLIENASDRDSAPPLKLCPKAFPIKASGYPEVSAP